MQTQLSQGARKRDGICGLSRSSDLYPPPRVLWLPQRAPSVRAADTRAVTKGNDRPSHQWRGRSPISIHARHRGSHSSGRRAGIRAQRLEHLPAPGLVLVEIDEQHLEHKTADRRWLQERARSGQNVALVSLRVDLEQVDAADGFLLAEGVDPQERKFDWLWRFSRAPSMLSVHASLLRGPPCASSHRLDLNEL